MTSMKSLLLGTAAGLVALTGAQAADLPVKAKAVQYVKVCSLYGAGFYYIPGTDTCLKVGGYVRYDAYLNAGSSGSTTLGTYNRGYTYYQTRARAAITLDARSQTAYGTLRSYAQFGVNSNGSGATTSPYIQFAYIQFAGFTFGNAESFFDIYAADQYHLNHRTYTNGSIRSDGINLAAYTANFGNGVSASISLEDPTIRRQGVFASTAAGVVAAANKGAVFPDVVANIRASGAWGFAQISGALHDASGAWYGPAGNGAFSPLNQATEDVVGWALAAGGVFKIPGTMGDTFGIQASYGKGATRYVTRMPVGLTTIVRDSAATPLFVPDATYLSSVAGGGSVDLTEAWGIEAGYEHVWMKGLKTSLTGGYAEINFNGASSIYLCGAVVGCNPDTSLYHIGSRTTWTPVENLEIAFDVVYQHFDTMTFPAGAIPAAAGAAVFDDADIWSGMVRVQRNFWK